MEKPDESTQLTPGDDTVINVPETLEDTIITGVDDATVVGSVVVEETLLDVESTVIEAEHTVLGTEDTQLGSTTGNYPTLISSLLEGDVALAENEPDAQPVKPLTHFNKVKDSQGNLFTLSHTLVIGRRPSATRNAHQKVTLVVANSPTGIISSNHVRIEQENNVVVVTDLGSTNGTRVSIPGQRMRLLGPGESAPVSAGATVDLGDGYRLEVLD